MDIYKENFYKKYLDPSLIPHNNITKYEFIKGNINELKLKNFYDYCKRSTPIVNIFNNAYNVINNCNYMKIVSNRKKYYDIIEVCNEVFTINNEDDSIRGILCNKKIQETSLEDKCILLSNSYEIIYDAIIEFNHNLTLFKNIERNKTITINYIVPSNNHYHYAMLLKNIVFIENKYGNMKYKIKFYGFNENSEYSIFMHLVQNISCIDVDFQYIENGKTLNDVIIKLADNVDIMFSSNVFLNNNNKCENAIPINYIVNSETLAKNIKIKIIYK